jgi:hypothetical protein
MKYWPRDARHEGHGHEDGNDGEGRGDNGEADLVGRVDGRAVGRLAHADVALDVLDLDDGVVHEDARSERDREERDEVEREAQEVHDPEGGNGRQGQRHGGDEGRAPVPQEQEHHEDGEDGPSIRVSMAAW